MSITQFFFFYELYFFGKITCFEDSISELLIFVLLIQLIAYGISDFKNERRSR